MTGKEAYKKICDLFGYEPIVKGCREYDRYYGFFLSPPGMKKEEPAFVGAMIVVDKNTGRVISDDADETVSLSGQRWKPVKLDEEDEEIEHSVELFDELEQNDSIKHAVSIFDELTDSYLMHYGTPGMHWRQQGLGKRYQSHAVYAQGRPNPDAKVRGQKEKKTGTPDDFYKHDPSPRWKDKKKDEDSDDSTVEQTKQQKENLDNLNRTFKDTLKNGAEAALKRYKRYQETMALGEKIGKQNGRYREYQMNKLMLKQYGYGRFSGLQRKNTKLWKRDAYRLGKEALATT